MKALIFDLDGVIVDSKEFHLAAWKQFAVQHGLELGDEFFRKTFGMTNRDILSRLINRHLDAADIAVLSEDKEKLYRESIRGNISALPGAL